MPVRCWFMVALIALSFVNFSTVRAQTISKNDSETQVVRTYSVAEQIFAKIDPRADSKKRDEVAEQLMKAITIKIAKNSWSDQGGSAAIRYFPNGMLLVVRQTAAAHKEIAKLLAEMRPEEARAADRTLRVAYPIADLVAPICDHGVMSQDKTQKWQTSGYKPFPLPEKVAPLLKAADKIGGACENKLGTELAAILRATLAAEPWEKIDNESLHYNPFGQAIVANHTFPVQKQIEALLAGLRKTQGMQVSFEFRILEASPALADRLAEGLLKGEEKLRDGAKANQITISEIQHFMLLEALAGDQNAIIRQLPKLTLYNGQLAGIDERNKQTGVRYDVRPIVSEDQKTVRVYLDFECTLPEKMKGQPRRIRQSGTFNIAADRTLVGNLGEVDGKHLFVTGTPRIVPADDEERIYLGTVEVIPGR